ncbi:MAG: UDP-N-acetylglucosamine 1-carboxyvinyltransferase [Candidatus Aminicenantes bacterium]|nr:UDP-N-acetylglucosamine 1-carboxyvinyltransferase [Candidatus Aminicenantes bacterium]
MNSVLIEGGTKLKGKVKISGAKNAALPELAAGLLTSHKVTLLEVPRVKDVETMLELLMELGAEIYVGEKIEIRTEKIIGTPREELFKAMRASVLILGPMLSRFGRAEILWPGGCSIGKRPINFHLMAMKKMGAEIIEETNKVVAKARRLHGTRIRFPRITVTGTENVIMAASLARGETFIENPAMEPEVIDLSNMLKKMGAKIEWQKEGVYIEGVEELCGTVHSVIPDRIEAGTFLVVGAVASDSLEIVNCNPSHMEAVLEKLGETGVEFSIKSSSIMIKGSKKFQPLRIETKEYPGFPTDMQAQFMVLMNFADGESEVIENIFPERFNHARELNKMGAEIEIYRGKAIIKGVRKLKGNTVLATDLRASASLVIAGLVAEGETEIKDIFHLMRGYENFFGKLRSIGASIKEG